MITLLVTLLVVAVIVYIVKLILDMLPLPSPAKTIVYIIFALIVILYLLNFFGLYSTPLK
jgi:predicted membrane channel-forming protein YqfA (hemolysin III family)